MYHKIKTQYNLVESNLLNWYTVSLLDPMSFLAISDKVYSSTKLLEIFKTSPMHNPPLQLVWLTSTTASEDSGLVRFSKYISEVLNPRQLTSYKKHNN